MNRAIDCRRSSLQSAGVEETLRIADVLLPEFEHEMRVTRTVLERVPDDDRKWKPHPKSSSMAELAGHIANIPMWVSATMQRTELETNPPGGYQRPQFNDREALLAFFDANVSAAREAIAGASNDEMNVRWTLFWNGRPIFTLPRSAVLRSFVLSHLIHHRGQLSVYLRLRDIAVPSIYGPSADEAV